MTEPGIESETFPLLEERSVTWIIMVRLPDLRIPALDMLASHPILHVADMKDEKEIF